MRLKQIERGSRGQQVQMLQHMLNTGGGARPPLDLDGIFGARTTQAVRDYQARRGLEVDGIVGAATWRSLGVIPSVVPGGRAAEVAPLRAPVIARAGTPTRDVPVPSIRRLAAAAASAPTPGTARVADPVAEPPGAGGAAPWMRVANAEKGVSEIAGRGANQRIVAYHATTGLGARSDEVPWCSSFVNWCLDQVGIRGTNSAAAASWSPWGQAVEDPRYGAIVHIFRKPRGVDGSTGSSSGNHVAFLVGRTATHISLLGGNQSNRVRVSNFPLSQYQVKAMRWPQGR